MRQNVEKAVAARRHNGVGPAYGYLLRREREQQRRFGNVNGMRRPRYLLDALERGEPVEVPAWRLGPWRPPGIGPSGPVMVTTDM